MATSPFAAGVVVAVVVVVEEDETLPSRLGHSRVEQRQGQAQETSDDAHHLRGARIRGEQQEKGLDGLGIGHDRAAQQTKRQRVEEGQGLQGWVWSRACIRPLAVERGSLRETLTKYFTNLPREYVRVFGAATGATPIGAA